MNEGICPVCGEKYFDKQEMELSWKQLDSFGSNALFAECVRITRGPDDSDSFEAETFGHTAEQAFAYRE